MQFDAFVAKRYLTARRKQAFIFVISVITLVGITIGVAALNVALAIHNGMRTAFVKSLVGETGSLQIVAGLTHAQGFDEEGLVAIMDTLADFPEVQAHALLYQESGVIVSERKVLQYANLFGILPKQFADASDRLASLPPAGFTALDQKDQAPFGIVIGADLADSLGVREGDLVKIAVPQISSPGLSRSGFKFREMKCRIGGTFKTGNSQFDERDAYLHLGSMFQLLNTTRVQQVLVKFASLEAMDRAKTKLIGNPKLPDGATVVDFRDLNDSLLQALQLEKLATTLVIGIFILVVALNMVSALIMLVMEKHRDIGIMRSFGVPRGAIMRIFVRQGMTLSFWGTLTGTIVGVALALILDRTKFFSLDNNVYEVLSYLPFEVHAVEVVLVALGSLLICFLTTLFPARQAAKLDPVEALKYD